MFLLLVSLKMRGCVIAQSQFWRHLVWVGFRMVGQGNKVRFSNGLLPFKNRTFVSGFWMRSENRNIPQPTYFWPFEIGTRPVFRSPLYFTWINSNYWFSVPGGSHWSLLIYSSQAKEFYHLVKVHLSFISNFNSISKRIHLSDELLCSF